MQARVRLCALLVLAVATLLLPTTAEARRGFVIISHGEDVVKLGEVKEEHRDEAQKHLASVINEIIASQAAEKQAAAHG